MVSKLFSRVYGENRDRVFGGYRSLRSQDRQAGEHVFHLIWVYSDSSPVITHPNAPCQTKLTPGSMVHSPRLGRLASSLHYEWNGLCSSKSTNLFGLAGILTSFRKGSRGASSRSFFLSNCPYTPTPTLSSCRSSLADILARYRPFLTFTAYRPILTFTAYRPSRKHANAPQLTAKNLPRLDEDERLSPVLTHLATSFLSGLSASEYTPENTDGTTVTAEMIDDIAKKHFPPCMRHLYERLKGDRHLKHFGRLQLGLFLKVCDRRPSDSEARDACR